MQVLNPSEIITHIPPPLKEQRVTLYNLSSSTKLSTACNTELFPALFFDNGDLIWKWAKKRTGHKKRLPVAIAFHLRSFIVSTHSNMAIYSLWMKKNQKVAILLLMGDILSVTHVSFWFMYLKLKYHTLDWSVTKLILLINKSTHYLDTENFSIVRFSWLITANWVKAEWVKAGSIKTNQRFAVNI